MIIPNAEKFYDELGGLIKTERLKRKITQDDLAYQLDLTRASVINLEKGRHRPSIYQIIVIAKYFDMDYTKLIPVSLDIPNEKTKEIGPADLSKMVSDQGEVDSSTRETIMDFLSSVRK
jgi:transcriptional regulator with XRE-family HTH domain